MHQPCFLSLYGKGKLRYFEWKINIKQFELSTKNYDDGRRTELRTFKGIFSV